MNKKALIAAAVVAVMSFCAGRFFGPKQVETREVEKVVYRDRIVHDVTSDYSRRTKEITLPDGSKVKETIVDRRSRTHTDSNREVQNELLKESKISNRADYRAGFLYQPPLSFQGQSWGVQVERRMIGEIYLGGFVFSDRTVGVSLSVGF